MTKFRVDFYDKNTEIIVTDFTFTSDLNFLYRMSGSYDYGYICSHFFEITLEMKEYCILQNPDAQPFFENNDAFFIGLAN